MAADNYFGVRTTEDEGADTDMDSTSPRGTQRCGRGGHQGGGGGGHGLGGWQRRWVVVLGREVDIKPEIFDTRLIGTRILP